MTTRRVRLSVLLVDDHHELLALYKRNLERVGPFRIATASTAEQAKNVAERQLFDLIVIDAKLEYRNTEFGGLRLADELKGRYGANAILVMSRFITADWMRLYGSDFEFVDKHGIVDAKSYYKALASKMLAIWSAQYVLVVMSFADEPTRLYKTQVKPAIESMGLRCVRADEVEHTRYIPSVVFKLVMGSKMVVLMADDLSPNAFYEAGFADAMRKEVVMVTRSCANMPFDVAQRSAIEYGNKARNLRTQLKQKLTRLRMVRSIGI